MNNKETNAVVQRLRDYLCIKSVQPTPDYQGCIDYLQRIGKELDLEMKIHLNNTKPLLVMTRKGTNSLLPSLLLTSHMDVVPVTTDKWSSDPFKAEIRDGVIYSRGVQDMKSVGMAYLEALRNLSQLPRTIHVLFVPDEEIGSEDGMKWFVTTKEFKALNVGFGIDEGVPIPSPKLAIFNAERSAWWIRIVVEGVAGHGSLMPQGTAIQRFLHFAERVYTFRDSQILKLRELQLGEVISVNITLIKSGVQVNVIPDTLEAYLDMRVPPAEYHNIDSLLKSWMTEGITYSIINKPAEAVTSSLDTLLYHSIKTTLQEMGIEHVISIFPGATDARFVRPMGIPVYGFTPFRNTPIRAHDHDECLSIDTYLEGINIYTNLIKKVANENNAG